MNKNDVMRLRFFWPYVIALNNFHVDREFIVVYDIFKVCMSNVYHEIKYF